MNLLSILSFENTLIPQPLLQISPANCKEVEMNFQVADLSVFTTIKLFYLDLIDKLKSFHALFLVSLVDNERK